MYASRDEIDEINRIQALASAPSADPYAARAETRQVSINIAPGCVKTPSTKPGTLMLVRLRSQATTVTINSNFNGAAIIPSRLAPPLCSGDRDNPSADKRQQKKIHDHHRASNRASERRRGRNGREQEQAERGRHHRRRALNPGDRRNCPRHAIKDSYGNQRFLRQAKDFYG